MYKQLIALLIPFIVYAEPIKYVVRFSGLEDKEALKTVRAASFLATLKGKLPISINALRFRAESDIQTMIKALHCYGYYEADIQVKLKEQEQQTEVLVLISPGPVYILDRFQIYNFSNSIHLECQHLNALNLDVRLGRPAVASYILDKEQKALSLLSECGYPLAKITNREMIADYATKTFSVVLTIDSGPLSQFGETTIVGAKHVKTALFDNKIAWRVGDTYDTRLIEKTQRKLLDTGLFSSTIINHEQNFDELGQLPIGIKVTENKHKTINIGASYQTYFGPGLTFGWENRNIKELGYRFSFQGDITHHTHTGTVTFLMPDFYRLEQDYIFQGQALQESILAYSQKSYSLTQRLEKKFDPRYRFSIGMKVERIFVSNAVTNGNFTLLEIPLYVRWSLANGILNPTKGFTIEYRLVPSINFSSMKQYYFYNSLLYTQYLPLMNEEFLTLAQQIRLDWIYSENLNAIPVPKRVLGGSDQELRGYPYHTVSPLLDQKPIGGRWGIFYTIEARLRLTKTIGIVPFFDIGSVGITKSPTLDQPWFRSIGIGFRYFTLLGPIRFDLAFPMHRRKGIDPVYRILVSIGQTF